MDFKGIKIRSIISTPEELMAHSYPLHPSHDHVDAPKAEKPVKVSPKVAHEHVKVAHEPVELQDDTSESQDDMSDLHDDATESQDDASPHGPKLSRAAKKAAEKLARESAKKS